MLARTAFLVSVVLLGTGCSGLRKKASGNAGTDTATGPDAAAIASRLAAAAPLAAAGRASDAGSTPGRERLRQTLADLKWMIGHKTTSPARAGEGDAVSKCDAVAASHAGEADPEAQTLLDEATALCAFDVPLVTANEALDQLRFTPSQASRLLGCNVAQRETDRARAVHPRDARVRQADARRASLCK
jgi:hypothetical protein